MALAHEIHGPLNRRWGTPLPHSASKIESNPNSRPILLHIELETVGAFAVFVVKIEVAIAQC
jgi:hypothetical protein